MVTISPSHMKSVHFTQSVPDGPVNPSTHGMP